MQHVVPVSISPPSRQTTPSASRRASPSSTPAASGSSSRTRSRTGGWGFGRGCGTAGGGTCSRPSPRSAVRGSSWGTWRTRRGSPETQHQRTARVRDPRTRRGSPETQHQRTARVRILELGGKALKRNTSAPLALGTLSIYSTKMVRKWTQANLAIHFNNIFIFTIKTQSAEHHKHSLLQRRIEANYIHSVIKLWNISILPECNFKQFVHIELLDHSSRCYKQSHRVMWWWGGPDRQTHTLQRTSTGVDIFFSLIFSYFCFLVAACRRQTWPIRTTVASMYG